ncbi:hypothetical protein CFU_1555 [Collimonas fungivorans Ter331]|uniref:Uncharacterized protein n=1 Tax=Collimonas fungivorans (strain Ter331) TaxID=1005048 RepID=G0AJU2_COLFT|nr:hypothetical protein CFU_1555 [Collimonas fungivorans Ter331]
MAERKKGNFMTLSPNESVWLPEIGFFIILQQEHVS